jgi:hypothetical protein
MEQIFFQNIFENSRERAVFVRQCSYLLFNLWRIGVGQG